jgi:hypothetical protein
VTNLALSRLLGDQRRPSKNEGARRGDKDVIDV